MPSLTHEAFIEFFRNDPQLAADLLRQVFGLALPEFNQVELAEATLSQVTPAEYRADLLLLLKHHERPILVIVTEVQLRPDPNKRFTWPAYAHTARHRHQCPACVLVICPDDAVARWAAAPIETGPQNSFVVFAIGPTQIPRVTDADKAQASPELAVLSALAHMHSPDGHRVVAAALQAALGLDATRASLYHDLVVADLTTAERERLEDYIMIPGYTYQTEFAQKHIAQGEAKGRAEGRVEGEAKGRAEGRAEGVAGAIATLLDLRGLAMSPAQEERLRGCQDLQLLNAWLARAVEAQSTQDVFGD